LGDQRPPTTLPPVQSNQASSSYWISQNCSTATVDCAWCVPSPIDLTGAPAVSTIDYTFRPTSFSWTDPILNGHSSTLVYFYFIFYIFIFIKILIFLIFFGGIVLILYSILGIYLDREHADQ
jgi:hypothetical protein